MSSKKIHGNQLLKHGNFLRTLCTHLVSTKNFHKNVFKSLRLSLKIFRIREFREKRFFETRGIENQNLKKP